MRFWRRLLAVVLVITGGTVAVGSAPARSAAVRPGAGQYVPLNPARIHSGLVVEPGTEEDFVVLGRGGIPSSGVSAVRITLSVIGAGTGWAVAFPTGTDRPGASHLNFMANVWDTNAAVVAPGTGGQVTLYSAGTKNLSLTVDVTGYYRAAGATVAGDTFVPLQPARIFSSGVAARGTVLVEPLGKAGIPTTGVSAVLASVTIVTTGTGNVTAYPDGLSAPPPTSNISFTDGQYTNQAPVKLGSNGKFQLYSTAAGTLYVDVVGYYQTPSGPAAGSSFVPLAPKRVLNTTGEILPANTIKAYKLAGAGGVPTTGVAAVAFNLTADDQEDNSGAMSVWAADQPTPVARTLSYKAGVHSPTLQVSRLSADGTVNVRNVSEKSVRLLFDVAGYYRAATVPAAPTAATARPGDGEATVEWTAPLTDGGAGITGYRITAAPGGATVDVDDALTSAVFAGLSNGTAYTFTVAARNAVGLGPAGSASAAATPLAATAPGAPTAVTVKTRHAAAVVSWQRPADDGRKPIELYTVTATPGGATVAVTAPTTEVEVPGLTNGTAYTFRVTATNERGTGPAGTSAAATPSTTVPDAPGDVAAEATATGTVGVSWEPPTYDGGTSVTGYTVTVQPGGRTVSVPSTIDRTEVTGLTAGTEYTFTVTATNARGVSAATTTAPLAPDLGLRAGTRVLSTAALATVTGVTDTAVTFTNAPVEVTGVPVGAVLVGDAVPEPHEPFLVVVTGVQTSGTTTTLAVRQAHVTEAYTDGSLALRADDAGEVPEFSTAGFSGTFGPVTLETGVVLSGTYTSKTKPDVQFDFIGPKKIILDVDERFELTLTADRKATDLGASRELAEIDLIPKRWQKRLKKYKPQLTVALDGFVAGHVHAGFEARTAYTVKGRVVIDLNNPTNSTDDLVENYERPWVGPIANAGVRFGITTSVSFTMRNEPIATVWYSDGAKLAVDVAARDWWTAEHCWQARVQLVRPPMEQAVWGHYFVTLPIYCRPVESAGGPLSRLEMVPPDAMLNPGGTTTFQARSRYGPAPITWTVDGGDANGTVQNGRYTAPAKTGVFSIVATVDPGGGRPAQRGTAYARVGAPTTPTLVATAIPAEADGTTRVQVGVVPNGPVPLFYRIRVEPPNPLSPCWANAWLLRGTQQGSYLRDRLAEDTSIRCDILRVGGTYRFYATAINAYGNSEEAASLPVTILGPGPVAATVAGQEPGIGAI